MTSPVEPVLKDANSQTPVATVWRPALASIVEAFVRKDYGLARSHIPGVDVIARDNAERIRVYVSNYGETLVDLPEEAWTSSVSQWMGDHWEVLVDLFTKESGRSDLVMHVRVIESAGGYQFTVDSVHVP